ncbi:hypothetical protein C0995_015017 [Termitomyces sp. Mi166|nr:hypothetical protein C0995_015017 [Termitomyces sp. Mi166\
MADGADILSAIQAIRAASKKVKITHELEESIEQLNSITKLLEIDTPSPAALQRLSLLLRHNLLPLYNTFLILGIRYAVAVLGVIFNAKVLPALKNCSTNIVSAWEAAQASLLSGILMKPAILWLTPSTLLFATFSSPVETQPSDLGLILFTSHPDNQTQLRNQDILGGADLGSILSQSKSRVFSRILAVESSMMVTDILVIEALLELIVKLLPSKRTSAAARMKFAQDVFDATKFPCGDVILKILETTPPTANWDIVFIEIIDLLGSTDSLFPQPFKTRNFHIQDPEKAYNVERLYVDYLGFVANIDEGDQIETLHASFVSVQSLKVAMLHDGKAAVTILFSPPPSVGQVVLATPSLRGTTVTFDIEAEAVARFLSSLKLRHVKNIDTPGKKLSKPEESLDLNFKPSNINPSISTQDKGRDLARLWDLSNSQPHAGQTLPTSPLMPRAISETQDAPASAVPTKASNRGSETKTSSPYYDSIFGTTDEELTDPSDTELNLTSRTKQSRGKQLRSVRKPRPEVMESDDESQIIRKVKSRRKAIILSDVETDRMKSSSQNAPETAIPTSAEFNSRRSLSKLKAQSLAEVNLTDTKTADGIIGRVDQPILKPKSVGDFTQQPDPPLSHANERPKARRKRKSVTDDIPEIDGPDSEGPPPKRLRTRPEPGKNPTESKPRPKAAPAKRYGKKGRTSSPILLPGPELNFDMLPASNLLSKSEEKQNKVSTRKGKGGKISIARATANKKKLKATEEKSTDVSTVVPSRRARTKAKTEGKTLSDDTKVPLLVKATEDKDKHSSKSAPQRRSARVTKTPNVIDEGTKMEQRSSAMPIVIVEPEETLEDEDASEQQVDSEKKPQRTPWEEINIKPLSTVGTTETIISGVVEPPTVPIIVQDAVTQESHVAVEIPASPIILQEADAQRENNDIHVPYTDPEEPSSLKEVEPSKRSTPHGQLKLEAHRILIDLTEDSPRLPKASTENSGEKKSKSRNKTPTPPPPENTLTLTSITSLPSPKLRPSFFKPNRPRVSFAPSALLPIQSTFDTAPELTSETSKMSYYPIKDEINEVMKLKSSYRFSKVRKDLRAGEKAILRETAQHLEEMYVESVQHHNNFVNLEAQYANHHRKIVNALKDACEHQQKTAAFLAATIQEHNRNSLSRKFPNNFFDSPLPSILLNPQLKL